MGEAFRNVGRKKKPREFFPFTYLFLFLLFTLVVYDGGLLLALLKTLESLRTYISAAKNGCSQADPLPVWNDASLRLKYIIAAAARMIPQESRARWSLGEWRRIQSLEQELSKKQAE